MYTRQTSYSSHYQESSKRWRLNDDAAIKIVHKSNKPINADNEEVQAQIQRKQSTGVELQTAVNEDDTDDLIETFLRQAEETLSQNDSKEEGTQNQIFLDRGCSQKQNLAHIKNNLLT